MNYKCRMNDITTDGMQTNKFTLTKGQLPLKPIYTVKILPIIIS